MKFFYNLERKFKRYAIPNLMYYIILMYGVGLLMEMFAPGFYWRFYRWTRRRFCTVRSGES